MAESSGPGATSVTVHALLIAIVVSALVGGTSGYLFAPKTVVGTVPPSNYVPQTRTFYLFTSILEFNESTFGIPHDAFTPDRMLVYTGDTVVIHYYTLETTGEDHTFTMDAPFKWTNGTAWPANGVDYTSPRTRPSRSRPSSRRRPASTRTCACSTSPR
ncbi:MAG: hypothetical protein AABX97_10245 [Candidatus Thermoplasmatota archaeon]